MPLAASSRTTRNAPDAQHRKRRKRDPQGTREAILEAAWQQLARDGKQGVSVAQVAQLAGVNRGTAYQHLRTRQQLIDADCSGSAKNFIARCLAIPRWLALSRWSPSNRWKSRSAWPSLPWKIPKSVECGCSSC
jgi:AcrR family transcriptional regulator